MLCPKCNHFMSPFETEDSLTLDLCNHCKALFFDEGELAEFFGLPSDVPKEDIPKSRLGRWEPLSCPRCDGDLIEIQYSSLLGEFDDLMIDRCVDCRGVLLDFGEARVIRKIAEKVINQESRLKKIFLSLYQKALMKE